MILSSSAAIVVLLLAELASGAWSAADTGPGSVFDAECVRVADGDTVTVLKERREIRIRLEGIDCPELHQDFGTRAKQFTSSLVFGKKVTVRARYLDRNGRTVARVSVDGKDTSLMLVEAGLAWHYKRYSSDALLAQAEERARRLKKGLWSVPSPVPPWEWRRSNRR